MERGGQHVRPQADMPGNLTEWHCSPARHEREKASVRGSKGVGATITFVLVTAGLGTMTFWEAGPSSRCKHTDTGRTARHERVRRKQPPFFRLGVSHGDETGDCLGPLLAP